MDHFTKGQTIKKHSGVDDDRQGGKRGERRTEIVPQRPTCGPEVFMLLHFHSRQLFDKTVQELDTNWPTYEEHYHPSKHCYSQYVLILIKSCTAKKASVSGTLIAFKCYEWQKGRLGGRTLEKMVTYEPVWNTEPRSTKQFVHQLRTVWVSNGDKLDYKRVQCGSTRRAMLGL